MFILIVAAVLRCAASWNDLWLDEVWSWLFARHAKSPVEILTRFRHDNNHPLNTFFLYLLGDQRFWVVYRIPALIAGLGTVLVSGWIARRRSVLEAHTAMLLTACSYLLVLYSSEARGYALAVFFALLSFHILERHLSRPTAVTGACFSLTSVLGMLSHFTFIHFYLAAVMWSSWRLAARSRDPAAILRSLASCHVAPMAFFVLLYFVFIRHLTVGGGPRNQLGEVLVSGLSLSIGGPEAGPAATGVCALAAALAAVSLWVLWSRRRDESFFFLIVLALSPGVLLLAGQPRLLFVRYFLVPLTFLLLLLSWLLSWLYQQQRWGRVLYWLLVLGFLGGNGWQAARLFRYGRGEYLAALRFMADHTYGEQISIASDHDFRNYTVLDFYARYLEPGKGMIYYPRVEWGVADPEWFITHSQSQVYVPPPRLLVRGREFRLVNQFPYASLSGWRWFVYHNASVPMKPAE